MARFKSLAGRLSALLALSAIPFLTGCVYYATTGVYAAPGIYVPTCQPGYVTVPVYYYGRPMGFRNVWNPCAFRASQQAIDTDEFAIRQAMAPESAQKLLSLTQALDAGRVDQVKLTLNLTSDEVASLEKAVGQESPVLSDAVATKIAQFIDYDVKQTQRLIQDGIRRARQLQTNEARHTL